MMEVKKFNAGFEIFVEGKQVEYIVIIKQGKCEITKKSLNKVNMN
jgi:CRP-like cAMP-binding protein